MRITLCAKKQPVIMYHGTTSLRLREILKKGLDPNYTKRVWTEDNDTGFYQVSRKSLPGTYFTSNLMTAISSASNATKKFKGESIIIIASIKLGSALLDEDLARLSGLFNGVMEAVTKMGSGHLSSWKLVLAAMLVGSDMYGSVEKEFLLQLCEYLRVKPVPSILEAGKDFCRNIILRKVFYIQTDDHYFNYHMLDYMKRLNDYEEVPNAEELLEIIPKSRQEAEDQYLKSIERLLMYSRKLSDDPNRNETYFSHNVRVTQPVTFSGANKIIGIVKLNKQTYKVTKIYGTIPPDFTEQFEKNVTKPLTFE